MKHICIITLALLLSACRFSSETPTSLVEYRSEEYGFSVVLPKSWHGFSVKVSQWAAHSNRPEEDSGVASRGPKISITPPSSTPEKPRQDIPVMVFTIQQWDHLQRGDWFVSAAPFNPSELGRNSRHVFALPPRYNYAFPEGWEEVEQILEGRPLQTFEPVVSQ